MRFGEAPDQSQIPANSKDKVMHATFSIGDTTLMASDGYCLGKPKFEGFSLTYNAANETEAKKVFDALTDGGQARMPLSKTFFAKSFGQLTDRFGVSWMVIAM
jgi:PhnB protein